jgi:hypothetical protein
MISGADEAVEVSNFVSEGLRQVLKMRSMA